MTSPVAVVVQRWHPGIAGGSEHLAFQFAQAIQERYPVELLTTTATDPGTWANALPPGEEQVDGVLVRRFPVTMGREACWFRLHELLVRLHHARKTEPAAVEPESFFGEPVSEAEQVLPWPVPLQEEWMRRQGPHSVPLLAWLRDNAANYRAFVFVTYLYSPTYFGTLAVDPARAILVSTLHDEPPAYLSMFRRLAGRVRSHIWLSEAERDLSRRLWGPRPGRVIPGWIEPGPEPGPGRAASSEPGAPPFILYCGRLDPGKGVDRLLDFFQRFKGEFDRPLDLVLTGTGDMRLPRRADIRPLGFVAESEKWRLLRLARVFVMPSPLESFSIVTLEAMAAGTPVLVNGANPVLREHIRKGDGRAFFDYSGFASELNALLEDAVLRGRIAEGARGYVARTFDRDRVRDALLAEIDSIDYPR